MAINIKDVGLQFHSNHSDRSGAPKGIVLHHAAATSCSVEDVHRWHLQNGWAGIGYHYFVRKDGSVYKGRPDAWLGAHTEGHNDRIGICAEGSFDKETMGATQQAAIVEVIRYVKGLYGDPPIHAHRDLDATGCPGEHYPFEAIVAAVNAKTTGTAASKAKVSDSKTNGSSLVKAFQEAAIKDGLPLNVYGADGLWGPETAAAAGNTLQIGSTGNRVKLAQQLLLGWSGITLPKYGVDGHFGVETQGAVKKLQSRAGIAVDGVIGLDTWKVLLGVNG